MVGGNFFGHYNIIKNSKGEEMVFLDGVDIKILEMLNENPFINQVEIGKRLKLTQACISVRLKQLSPFLKVVIKKEYVLLTKKNGDI